MAMPASVRRRWTRAEVLTLIHSATDAAPRYELVDGQLLVTPSPGGPHQFAVAELNRLLGNWLLDQPVGRVAGDPLDFELEPGTILRPDVGVVPLHEKRRLLTEMPGRELMLVVEVLSPSSARFDRGEKRELYQRRVPEYWIVDLDARRFERWRPGDARPEILRHAVDWQPQDASSTFQLSIPEFFARVFEESI